jgi:hypothetical protein
MIRPKPLKLLLLLLSLSIAIIPAISGELKSEEEQERMAEQAMERMMERVMTQAGNLEEARLEMKKFLKENPRAFGEAREELEKMVENQATFTEAIERAKAKARSISCINNLKMLRLAFTVWASDNGDKYPFQLSATDGGSREKRKPGEGGYDSNALIHFRMVAENLASPKILWCPADTAREPAERLSRLSTNSITYQLRTDSKVAPEMSSEVLLRCPIHGHVIYCDGTIRRGDEKPGPSN